MWPTASQPWEKQSRTSSEPVGGAIRDRSQGLSPIRDRVLAEEIPDAAPTEADKVDMPFVPHGWLAVGHKTSPLRGFRSPRNS